VPCGTGTQPSLDCSTCLSSKPRTRAMLGPGRLNMRVRACAYQRVVLLKVMANVQVYVGAQQRRKCMGPQEKKKGEAEILCPVETREQRSKRVDTRERAPQRSTSTSPTFLPCDARTAATCTAPITSLCVPAPNVCNALYCTCTCRPRKGTARNQRLLNRAHLRASALT